MRIRIDNILLCILWLLAMTLGACFWFNTFFGFDIFSATHWGYLSSMQAAQTPIRSGFYVSIAIVIFITILGLYIIMRPRRRKIRMPIVHVSKINTNNTTSNNTPNKTTTQNPDASTLDIMPAEIQPAQIPNHPTTSNAPSAASRPPRLVLPTLNGNYISQPRTPTLHGTQSQQPTNNDLSELRNIFSDAGYTVKPSPRVNGIQIALLAIGANETMWIGCVNTKTTDIRAIIEKFQQVFSDTLDETTIAINGFAINAPDAATSEFQDILMFANTNELREYMRQNPNPPLDSDDDGMFDAYSQYIDAVINHIGKF